VAERLGDERVEILRRWGQGLSVSGRDEEMRAAGRAIVLLVEEIGGFQRDLWHARAGVSNELAGAEDERPAVEPAREPIGEQQPAGPGFVEALTGRLAQQLPAVP
jgi:hypothetical protein